MSEHITAINARQRVDMIGRGLNPLNPDHVSRYLKGDGKGNVNENIDRIKAIMGDKLGADLGHGAHKDMALNFGAGEDGSGHASIDYSPEFEMQSKGSSQRPLTEQDYRNQMNTDMDSYATSAGNVNYSGGGLDSLREPARPQQQKLTLNEVQTKGNKLATNYYNAFINSLKNPGTTSMLEVYKAMEALLKQEKAYQGTKAHIPFRESVNLITNKMYNKLKG